MPLEHAQVVVIVTVVVGLRAAKQGVGRRGADHIGNAFGPDAGFARICLQNGRIGGVRGGLARLSRLHASQTGGYVCCTFWRCRVPVGVGRVEGQCTHH